MSRLASELNLVACSRRLSCHFRGTWLPPYRLWPSFTVRSRRSTQASLTSRLFHTLYHRHRRRLRRWLLTSLSRLFPYRTWRLYRGTWLSRDLPWPSCSPRPRCSSYLGSSGASRSTAISISFSPSSYAIVDTALRRPGQAFSPLPGAFTRAHLPRIPRMRSPPTDLSPSSPPALSVRRCRPCSRLSRPLRCCSQPTRPATPRSHLQSSAFLVLVVYFGLQFSVCPASAGAPAR